MMCRVLFTRDGEVFSEPYVTPPPPWQRADNEDDLERIAEEAGDTFCLSAKRENGPTTRQTGFRS